MNMHLAQINIATLRAPMEHPSIAGFTNRLEEINALADASPGFVWRLQTDDGDATSLRPYDDERVVINMSVWETLGALKDFVYRSHHVQLIRGRDEWFHRPTAAVYALWWVPAGHLPSVEEAMQRLEHLRTHGSTPQAFSFAKTFEPALA
jgi:hypothetical protein